MTIGERIKAAREQAGITQVELGEKIGVSGVAIMRYEKNARQPRIEQLQAIAAALDVSPFYLLGDETATMSRADVAASMGLEDYLKSLGYEFIVGYEYEGEEHDLCIDRKRKKLYLLPPQQLAALEQSLETFAKFSLSELVSGGKEISDTEGWFSRRQDGSVGVSPAPGDTRIPPPLERPQRCRQRSNRGHTKSGTPSKIPNACEFEHKETPASAANTHRGDAQQIPGQSIKAPLRPFMIAYPRRGVKRRKEGFAQWHGKTQRGAVLSARKPSPATAKSTPIGRPGSPRAGTLGPGSRSSALSPARRRQKSGANSKLQPWLLTKERTPPRRK